MADASKKQKIVNCSKFHYSFIFLTSKQLFLSFSIVSGLNHSHSLIF